MALFVTTLIMLKLSFVISDVIPVKNVNKPECPLVNEDDIFDFFERNGTRSSWTRPVRNFSHPIAVSILFLLWSVVQLDEKSQELTTRASTFISWFDEFRVWNETFPLNCIDSVVLPFGQATKIWTPNICFVNG